MYGNRKDPRKEMSDLDNPSGMTVSTNSRYVGSRSPKHLIPESYDDQGEIGQQGFQLKTTLTLRDKFKGDKLKVQTLDFGQNWSQINSFGTTLPLSPRSGESVNSKLESLRFKNLVLGNSVNEQERDLFHTGELAPKKPDYSWKRHPDSDVESDDEDPNTLFRALRNDEKIDFGIFPKAPKEKRTVSLHVTSGTKKPSQLLSLTRSKRVAFKWALEEGSKRVVKVRLHDRYKRMDLTSDINRRKVISGATTLNFAKSSKEVLLPGRIPKRRIQKVYDLKINPSPNEVSVILKTRKARQKKMGDTPVKFGFL